MYSTRLSFYPGLRTLILVLRWHEWRNTTRKWYLCIWSTKFSEWSILNKVRPSSINKWCRHYNHNSGHKILELPAPNNNKITIQEFIKYLLDTWKTKPFVRDHGSERAQWLNQPVLWAPAKCSPHLPVLVPFLLSAGKEPVRTRWFPRLIHITTAHHGSFAKLRPGLGSYEGCSFICSSLIHESLSSAGKPGEDQTKEHTQRHDNVGYVADDRSSVNHRL